MTPSFIGRYAMMESGVRPIISFASTPMARILLFSETATTEGSFNTMPRPGTNTRMFVVPRSMPSFGEKNDMRSRLQTADALNTDADIPKAPLDMLIPAVNVVHIINHRFPLCNDGGNAVCKPRAQIRPFEFPAGKQFRTFHPDTVLVEDRNVGSHFHEVDAVFEPPVKN